MKTRRLFTEILFLCLATGVMVTSCEKPQQQEPQKQEEKKEEEKPKEEEVKDDGGIVSAPVPVSVPAELQKESWWPEQKAPKTLAVCKMSGLSTADYLLAESVSGNVTRAINEGILDEALWLSNGERWYNTYLNMLVERLGAPAPVTYSVWDAVKRYKEKGAFSSYVLFDASNGGSINIATIWAGYYKALMVDVNSEAKAKAAGLTLAYDCRKESMSNTFEQLKDKLNNKTLVIASDSNHKNRDYAISNRCMVYYGVDGIYESILAWMEPLSIVVGWNSTEDGHIAPCSKYGLVNAVSDYCMNLPILSAEADKVPITPFKSVNPKTDIDWNDTHKGFHSFVISDGDNMQFITRDFHSDHFWECPNASSVKASFQVCGGNLALASPDVLNQLTSTQPAGCSIVEATGYYYPDYFGVRSKYGQEVMLRAYAKVANAQLKKSGAKLFSFIVQQYDSNEAKKAYEIFAQELEGIAGILVCQYSPYAGGKGTTYWYPNSKGEKIPIITARYQLWKGGGGAGDYGGSPSEMADNINRDAFGQNSYWTIVHAWSEWDTGVKAVDAAKSCASKLMSGTKVVNAEEAVWRARMKKYPISTKKIVEQYK